MSRKAHLFLINALNGKEFLWDYETESITARPLI